MKTEKEKLKDIGHILCNSNAETWTELAKEVLNYLAQATPLTEEQKFDLGIEIIAGMKAEMAGGDMEEGRYLALEDTEFSQSEYEEALKEGFGNHYIKHIQFNKERLHKQAYFMAEVALNKLISMNYSTPARLSQEQIEPLTEEQAEQMAKKNCKPTPYPKSHLLSNEEVDECKRECYKAGLLARPVAPTEETTEYEMFFKSEPDDIIKIDGWVPIATDRIKRPELIPEYLEKGLLRHHLNKAEETTNTEKA
ncbi:hypothetical protein AHMF7605_11900 [Adhaeribacter arboris]|uniref:Uncharacterized protein n=1 Tax=Adhaeribacter arboris TaxID=2072846 RepID=A0A2T2YF96_9BACT|nr:hypothetical protein [Adhaeribacter arboris]PSR54174.1 hypothetical protein AHMF7605_11900 [Adhaeribacter arboris]